LLPKLIPQASKEDVALLFISQVRKNIGVMFGDDEDVAGGNAPKFYASVIMKIRRKSANKEDGVKVSNKVEIECVKNQIAPPFRKGVALIEYGHGFSAEEALLTLGIEREVLSMSGTWYVFDGEKIGHGAKKAAKALRDNPDLRKEIYEQVKTW
jgi:recombination protein RecA